MSSSWALLRSGAHLSPLSPAQVLLGEYKQLASSRDSGAQAAVAKAEAEVKKVQVGAG